MNDCDGLLRKVMEQASALQIPFSEKLDTRVRINRRAVTRFGCCIYKEGKYVIEVAERVALGPEESCMETLAHELLHTCYGCRNHGKRWKGYAEKMNRAYGYAISRSSTNEELRVKEMRPCKYLLRCENCGMEFKRFRSSDLTKHPERYRCKCGGRLYKIEMPEGQNEEKGKGLKDEGEMLKPL